MISPLGYRFTEDGQYSVPDLFPLTVSSVSENENDSTPETAQSQSVFDHNAMLRYVDALPDVAGASIFGLLDNAESRA